MHAVSSSAAAKPVGQKPTNDWTREEVSRNFWADLTAAFVVSLVALIFGLAIAEASGADPITGLYSGIIAGIASFLFRGPFVTVSGPAAGLSMVLLGSMMTLGNGDKAVGFPLLAAAIIVVGAVQILIALLGWAKIGEIFPPSVTHAMLAAIGVLIIVKELPLIIGTKAHSHEFMHLLAEIPSLMKNVNWPVFGVGGTCLALIFALTWVKDHFKDAAWILNVIPPAVVTVFVGLMLGVVLQVDQTFLIHVPNPFDYGLAPPIDKFAVVFNDPGLLWKFVGVVALLTTIDMVETLATIKAVDENDPWRRHSDPNKTLLGIGFGNLLCGLTGRALTNIPGGIKSNLAINMGARTLFCSLWVSLFLIVYVFFGRSVINMMPLAALAAIIMHTGFKLCAPHVWYHTWQLGWRDLIPFVVTVFVTLWTDLLYGIAAGVATKYLVLAWSAGELNLFKNPVQTEAVGEEPVLHIVHSVTCFNLFRLIARIEEIHPNEKRIHIRFNDGVRVLDHMAVRRLLQLIEELETEGRTLLIEGWNDFVPVAAHEESLRLRERKLEMVGAE